MEPLKKVKRYGQKVILLPKYQQEDQCIICYPSMLKKVRGSKKKVRSDFKWTPEYTLNYIVQHKDREGYGESPVSRSVNFQCWRYFKNVNHAYTHLGVKCKGNPAPLMSKEDVVKQLLLISPDPKQRVAPATTKLREFRHRIRRIFHGETFQQAMHQLGFKTYLDIHGWTAEKLIDRVQYLSPDGIHAPLLCTPELQRISCAVRDIFGSWSVFIKTQCNLLPHPNGRPNRTLSVIETKRYRDFTRVPIH